MSTLARHADLMPRAERALFAGIVADGRHDAAGLARAREEVLSLGTAVGAGFVTLLLDYAASRLAARLPRVPCSEVRRALRYDLTKLLGPDLLVQFEAEGQA
jgi:hypothetical protein